MKRKNQDRKKGPNRTFGLAKGGTVGILLLLIISVGVVGLIGPAETVRAEDESAWIDNFEDDPDGPYGDDEVFTDNYREPFSEPGTFKRSESDDALVGDTVLYADEFELGSNNYLSMPGDGLPNYPDDGDTITGFMYQDHPEDSYEDPNPMIGWYGSETNDELNGYIVNLDSRAGGDSNYLDLRRYDEGSTTLLTESEEVEEIEPGQWYEFVIVLDGDTFTASIYEVDQDTGERGSELETISASDNTYHPDDGDEGFIIGARGSGTEDDEGVEAMIDGVSIGDSPWLGDPSDDDGTLITDPEDYDGWTEWLMDNPLLVVLAVVFVIIISKMASDEG